jgi:uncharacterized OsmC-like protein
LSTQEKIKRAFERNARALELRPAMGQRTAVTRVRVREGYTCEVEDGDWKLTADMPEKSGGANLGPNPGVFGRSALGTCLAIAYTSFAAKRELPVQSLEIEIQADYDARGEHGVEDIRCDYSEVRYVVSLESTASEEEVRAVLEEAEIHCPYLQIFQNPQKLRRVDKILASGG